MREPRTITLTLRAWILFALFGAALLALLGGQFVFIVQQRQIVDHQRDIAQRNEVRSAEVLETGRALIGSEEGALDAAARAGRALTDLQTVLDTLIETEVLDVTAQELRRLPELRAAVAETVEILERTYPTLRESLSVQRRSLGVQEQSLSVQDRSLGIQEQALRTQGELLARADQLLAVAQETLVHVRSIDSKTGGPVPGPAGR